MQEACHLPRRRAHYSQRDETPLSIVIPGRPKGEPGIHTPDGSYGFRVRDFVAPRNDERHVKRVLRSLADIRADMPSVSRGTMCPSHSRSCPSKSERAQGMPGEGLTHGPPATRKAGGSHHRCSRSSGIPCAMGYGLYEVSPGTGFLAPVFAITRFARYADISTGMPGPHDFAVRLRRDRLSRPPRPPLPASTLVTIGRNVPLHRGGMACSIVVICPTTQATSSRQTGTTGNLRMAGMREAPVGRNEANEHTGMAPRINQRLS